MMLQQTQLLCHLGRPTAGAVFTEQALRRSVVLVGGGGGAAAASAAAAATASASAAGRAAGRPARA
eukprot:365402-Chlamydomonas_euryale.AAC.1